MLGYINPVIRCYASMISLLVIGCREMYARLHLHCDAMSGGRHYASDDW
jgi:hypothetical protein